MKVPAEYAVLLSVFLECKKKNSMATGRKNCLFESEGGNEMNYQCQACDIWYRHLLNISAYVLLETGGGRL